MITLTTYKWIPDFAVPLMRAFRVRWAMEEAGLPYDVRTLALGPEQKSPGHLARQPFGQAPAIEEDGLVLFESGAIALYIAGKSEALLPADRIERERAIAWVFAALNSVEICVQQLGSIDFFHSGEEWTKAWRPKIEDLTKDRLAMLERVLEGKEYLEGRLAHPRSHRPCGGLSQFARLQAPLRDAAGISPGDAGAGRRVQQRGVRPG